jgi:hypothetical protein
MKRNTIIVILLVILLVILVYTTTKNEHLTPQSNEAIQSVASIYNKQQMTLDNLNVTQKITGNLTGNVTGNVTGNINGDLSGNVTGTANLSTLSSDLSGNPINVNSSMVYEKSLRPIVFSVAIGSTTCPIVDLSGNTYSPDKYMCKVLFSNNYNPTLGIKNNKWWIGNTLWNNWQVCTLEFSPITNYNVLSMYNYDTTITATDGSAIDGTDYNLGRGFVNGGYYVFDSSNLAHSVTPPSS